MKTRLLFPSLSIAILTVLLLTGCSPSQSNSEVAQATVTPLIQTVTSPPKSLESPTVTQATAIPLIQTCNGWTLRLHSVAKNDHSDGWTYLSGILVIENAGALDSGVIPLYDFLGQPPTMRTNEGYSYPLDWLGATAGNTNPRPVWVPPGFRYTMVEGAAIDSYQPTGWQMRFKVASSTSGHVANTKCGILDYNRPESAINFPTDQPSSSFTPLGTALQLPEGTLTFTKGSGCQYGGICLAYNFTNASQGYEVNNQLYVMMIGADGIVHRNQEGWADCCLRFYAGPGQSATGVVSFITTSTQNLKLILARWPPDSEYWVVNVQ